MAERTLEYDTATKRVHLVGAVSGYTHPNHTGDVTSVGDGAQTIAAGAVTNAKRADMPAWTLSGNNSASDAAPQDIAVGDLSQITTPASGDMLFGFRAGAFGWVDWDDLPMGGGGGGDFMADGSVAMTDTLAVADGTASAGGLSISPDSRNDFGWYYVDHASNWNERYWALFSGGASGDVIRFNYSTIDVNAAIYSSRAIDTNGATAYASKNNSASGVGFDSTGNIMYLRASGVNMATITGNSFVVGGNSFHPNKVIAMSGSYTAPDYTYDNNTTSGWGRATLLDQALYVLGSKYARVTWQGKIILGSGNASVDSKTAGVQFDTDAYFGDAAEFGDNVDMGGLPTSDPTVAGRLWNDSGTLKVSAG